MVNKSKKTYFSRNVPKLIGNGSYSLWGSWEPVFYIIITLFYIIIRNLFFLLFITPIPLLNFLFPWWMPSGCLVDDCSPGGLEVEWVGKENEVDWIGVEERKGDW